jgi:hypothetical protein
MAKQAGPRSKPHSPSEFAAGVYWLTAGRGPLATNVYFIRTATGGSAAPMLARRWS